MSRRDLTPSEKRTWARIARTAKPLPGVSVPTPDPGPVPEDKRIPPAQTAAGRQDLQAPNNPPVGGLENRANHRRVRRGQTEIDARIDLHGLTQAQADRALPDFLRAQRAMGARCVLVITGKGRGGEGVLRRNFLHWLDTPTARHLLSGWSESHARHGGAGAFYVYIRRLKS